MLEYSRTLTPKMAAAQDVEHHQMSSVSVDLENSHRSDAIAEFRLAVLVQC